MKHTKSETIPASTRMVVYKTTCDLRGAEINPGYFDAEEVVVKHRTGRIYPEGGSGEEISVDMCGECFDRKLVPWFRAQGSEPRQVDWSW